MSPNDTSYVDGGIIKYESSIFAHFDAVLKSSATEIAIRVAHQEADYLEDFGATHEIQIRPDNEPKILGSSCLSWTYAQLHHAAVQVVYSLNLRNVTAGSTIMCLVPNGIEWIIVLWASILGKFTLSTLDFGALSVPRAHELEMLLRRIKPDVIFVSGVDGANEIDRALESQELIPEVKVTFQPRISKEQETTTTGDASRWINFRSLAVRFIPLAVTQRIEEEALFDDHSRLALVIFTSGTTAGTPKGCPHTVRGMLHTMSHNWDNGSTRPPRRLVQTANYRIIAPSLALCTWAECGTVVLPSAISSPQTILAALCDQTFAITFCLFIPAQLHAVIALTDFATRSEQIEKHGHLKVINLGGDIVTDDLYNKARKAFPSVDVRVGCGMTEGGASFTWPANLESPPFHSGIAPVGKTNAGTRLKLATATTYMENTRKFKRGMPLKRGEVGELHLWNESFIRGYLDGINAENFYVDEDGHRWFDTGDIGLIDEDDWVYILGRKKDIIKRAGIAITPAAIENSLDAYLGSNTCVVGVPHSTFGQIPVAVVKSLELNTKEDVKQHVAAIFGPDYGLGNVFTLQELSLDDFPVNATGKVLKRELLERIASLR